MARLDRSDVFSPEQVAVVHVMDRVVRRCFLLGTNAVTGKNYVQCRVWVTAAGKLHLPMLENRDTGASVAGGAATGDTASMSAHTVRKPLVPSPESNASTAASELDTPFHS